MRAALFLPGSPWTDIHAFKHMGHRFHIKSTQHSHSRYVVREKVRVQLRYSCQTALKIQEEQEKFLTSN